MPCTGGFQTFQPKVPAGRYKAHLADVVDCICSYKNPSDGTVKESPGIEFQFVLELPGGQVETLGRKVTKTLSKRGAFYGLMKMLLSTPLADRAISSESAAMGAVKHCVGKDYDMVVSVNERGYSLIEAVLPLQVVGGNLSAPKAVPMPPVKEEPKDKLPFEDDIPF